MEKGDSMGWTSYHVTPKSGNRVDRKAECRKLVEGSGQAYRILADSMKGSTYYAAVKCFARCSGKDEDGNYLYEQLPEDQHHVFAAIILTHTDSRDWYNFSYKYMDESCGPCWYECPKKVLDLLTPTDSEWANEWRRKCRKKLENSKNSISKAPLGTKVSCIIRGSEMIFEKTRHSAYKNPIWLCRERNTKISARELDRLGYTVVEEVTA